jgi:hypothetical protein
MCDAQSANGEVQRSRIADVRAQLNEKYYNYLASALQKSVVADLLNDESFGASDNQDKEVKEVSKDKKKSKKNRKSKRKKGG